MRLLPEKEVPSVRYQHHDAHLKMRSIEHGEFADEQTFFPCGWLCYQCACTSLNPTHLASHCCSHPFAQPIADYSKRSIQIENQLLTAIRAIGESIAHFGYTTSTAISLFLNAWNNWVNNVSGIHYFSDMDSLCQTNPQAIITTALGSLSGGLSVASGDGYPNLPTSSELDQKITTFQTLLAPSAVTTFGQSGSQTTFTAAGQVMASYLTDFVSNETRPEPDVHSSDCACFFWLGIFAALTGNEVAAIFCAICYYELDC